MTPLDRRRFLQLVGNGGIGLGVIAILGCEGSQVTDPRRAKAPPMVTPPEQAFILNHSPIEAVSPVDYALVVEFGTDIRTYAFDQLRGMLDSNGIEMLTTVVCVFDGADQDMAYTGVFGGLPLSNLLPEAFDESARCRVEGLDGFVSSFPMQRLRQAPQPMLALTYNGKPLSHERGFPARLILPGYYAFKHVKYLSRLTLIPNDRMAGDFEEMFRDQPDRLLDGRSKFHQPLDTAYIAAGETVLAGYAFPSAFPVTRVEVQVDDGEWSPARIQSLESYSDEILAYSQGEPQQLTDAETYPFDGVWVPWTFRWHATPGSHRLRLRAHTAEAAQSSADGYRPVVGHEITVTVE